MKKLFIQFWCVLGIFLLFRHPVSASILITELHPNPTTNSEWIELYNPDPQPVDLNNWTLWDILSSPSLLVTLTQTLESQSYTIIEVNNKLNNSGDGVLLKNAEATTIHQVSFSNSPSGLSWALLTTNPDSWSWQNPTPNAPALNPTPSPSSNPTPTPTPFPEPNTSPSPSPTPTISPTPGASSFTSTTILFSEVMACPESGQPEWIEIVNTNNFSVTLAGWKIRDASGQIRNINTQIAGQDYAVIEWPNSLLNNSGDTISFITDQNQVSEEFSYASCVTGSSWSRHQDEWSITDTPTPGSANTITNLNTDDTNDTNRNITSTTNTTASPSPNNSPLPLPLSSSATPPIEKRLPTQLSHLAVPHLTRTLITNIFTHPPRRAAFVDHTPPQALILSGILSSVSWLCVGSWLWFDRSATNKLQAAHVFIL